MRQNQAIGGGAARDGEKRAVLARVSKMVLAVLACLWAACPARAQCGPSISARLGGEVSAVAQVSNTAILVARGSEVEIYSLANPGAPSVFSPRRRTGLTGRAVKIAMTPGSSRAFVLLEGGDIDVLGINYSPLLTVGRFATIPSNHAVDILADDTRVYSAYYEETYHSPDWFLDSWISIYSVPAGTVTSIGRLDPLPGDYGYDRLARVGNVLWAGFHQLRSSIYGVDGFDISTSASATRVGAALNNVALGVETQVTAMASIGNNLFLSYSQSSGIDFLRAVDVSAPLNPVWRTPTSLNALAGCFSTIGNQLRVTFQRSAVGTYDVSNPNNLVFMGALFDSFPEVGQMVSTSGTDYWAGGPAGLMTINTTNPAAMSARSAPIAPLPIRPSKVRQNGTITVELDYALNALRFYDYTLPESFQLRGSFQLPVSGELMEVATLSGGAIQLLCVADAFVVGQIAIIDITNPAAPVTRSIISNIGTNLLSASGSRLYIHTNRNELKIYELAVPTAPQLRSTTPFGGRIDQFTCMTSWSNNAAAIGTDGFGLWLMDTTNATAPFVAGIWNPVTGYVPRAVTKGANYLYVSAEAPFTSGTSGGARLESLNVANLSNPTLRFADTLTTGTGLPPVFTGLQYVTTPIAKFLVGVHDRYTLSRAQESGASNYAILYELPPGFLTNEGVPFPTARVDLPYADGTVAANAAGTSVFAAGDRAGLYQVSMPTNWAPAFGVEPRGSDSTCGRPNSLSLTCFASANPTTITYQWYRDGVALVDGVTPWGTTITGATTFNLEFTRPRYPDARYFNQGFLSEHRYTCVATNSCGSTTSGYATLNLCPADLDDGTGTGSCDGGVTIEDLLYFLGEFGLGSLNADLDDGSGTGVPDNGVTIDDLLFFLVHYAGGC